MHVPRVEQTYGFIFLFLHIYKEVIPASGMKIALVFTSQEMINSVSCL